LKECFMKRRFIIFLVFALLFSGCDALKSLYGDLYGVDDGPDSGSNSDGSGFDGGNSGGNGFDSGNSGGSGFGGGGSGGNGEGDGTRDVSAAFEGVTADGEGTTTLVSLVFDRNIPGLSENDITVLDPDDKTGAVKGVLSPAGLGGIYTLGIAGVRESGEIAVRVGKNGWTINPASRPAQVYYDPGAVPVTFVNIMPDGTAGSQTTTALTLTFNQAIPDLNVNDITLAAGFTGAAMGSLNNTGLGTYSLAVSGITAAGDVGVTVSKSGYTVNPATISVPVYYYPVPLAKGGTTTFWPVDGDPSQIWEIHTFKESGTLEFIGGTPPVSVTAQVLVVAGGGGGGAGRYPGSGAGAGGMVENNAYSLTAASYQAVVGAGGKGGTGGNSPGVDDTTWGTNGYDSSFDGILAKGGGRGGKCYFVMEAGSAGGSSGGGSSSPNVVSGTGGTSSGNKGGVLNTNKSESAGGGGGAGGPGTVGTVNRNNVFSFGGPGKESSITGTSVTYAAGGPIAGNNSKGRNGGDNTGNGGGGGWNSGGGDGGSGIVIVRFQRPN
jgi:hypothetical protein